MKGEVVFPRLLQLANEPAKDFRDVSLALIIPECDWVKVPGDTIVDDARKMVMASKSRRCRQYKAGGSGCGSSDKRERLLGSLLSMAIYYPRQQNVREVLG